MGASTAIESVREEVGSARGRVEILLVAETAIETGLGGEPVAAERTDRLTVESGTGVYSVSEDPSAENSDQVRETVTVPVESDPVREYGSLIALMAGVAGAAVVVGLRLTGRLDVDPETRAAIERRRERDAFSEWISVGRVPDADGDRVVELASLEDLVDVAIDSDRRVVEDSETGAFVVLDGATQYTFDPESIERAGGATARPDRPEGPGGADAGDVREGDANDGDDPVRLIGGTGDDRSERTGEGEDGDSRNGDTG